MKEIIKIENLSKIYKTGSTELYAVNDISLSINEGEIVTILGPSGSGKSTLVNIIGGIDTADSGNVIVDRKEVTSLKNGKLTDYRRDSIGFVFQFYNLIPNLNVYENVEVVADISSNPLNIDELLKNLGIYELAKRYPVELSGGQQQRVAIARAFVKNPKLLLCDEPTGALDSKSSLEILKLIQRLNKDYNTTILIITHNQAISDMCHRTIKIRDGKIRSDKLNENIVPVDEISW